MSAMENADRRLRFDGTITAGNLLTMIGMIVALVVWGLRLEGRVDMGDRAMTSLEKRVDSSETEIKQYLRDLNSKLDRFLERYNSPRKD